MGEVDLSYDLETLLRLLCGSDHVGRGWHGDKLTMVGYKRLRNVRVALETVVREGIPGDFLEAGVWRGGTCIFARKVLDGLGETERKVYACDSFQGLPASRDPKDTVDFHGIPELAVSEEEVRRNAEKYSAELVFVPGFFADTLPILRVELAVLRLDGDLYVSTRDSLVALYDSVSPGGYVIVDDYLALSPCRQAVDEFRAKRKIRGSLTPIDQCGIYWRKT